jgi:hypothetical protein
VSAVTSIATRAIAFPGYFVDADGVVWSAWQRNGRNPRVIGEPPRSLNPNADGDGYLAVNLFRDGRAHRRKVHLLVLEAFIGPRPDGMQGCHENGVVADCRLSNLRWDTPAANQRDRLRHGTHCRGERSPRARLTAESARLIRDRLRGGERAVDLARAFGVAPSTIHAIKSGRLWGWLEEERRAG